MPKLGGLGGWEWIIILVIVIVIFGVGKLPQAGAALGQSIREFRESMKSKDDEAEPNEPAGETKA